VAEIHFEQLPTENIPKLKALFSLLKQQKDADALEGEDIRRLLGSVVDEKFWHPTEEERQDWQRRWDSTPVEKRFTDPSLKTPWDFDSWVDALENAEIQYLRLSIEQDGHGVLEFDQLACPSGGIESSEEIIKILGGVVTRTDCL
jgi:hypothetical protein